MNTDRALKVLGLQKLFFERMACVHLEQMIKLRDDPSEPFAKELASLHDRRVKSLEAMGNMSDRLTRCLRDPDVPDEIQKIIIDSVAAINISFSNDDEQADGKNNGKSSDEELLDEALLKAMFSMTPPTSLDPDPGVGSHPSRPWLN